MDNYYLTDIHFHTDLSFDAYSNGVLFNTNEFGYNQSKTSNPIKMLVKTDHNIFNFKKYNEYKKSLSVYDIVLLPGIEIKGENEIHWIFIFSDNCLDKKVDGEQTGDILDKKIMEYYGYSTEFPPNKELEEAQKETKKIDKFISILNRTHISFLAIPHLDKSSGLYKALKKNHELLAAVEVYLNESIINGFESKKYDDFFKENVSKTEGFIHDLEKRISAKEEIDPIELIRREKHYQMLKAFSEMVDRNNVASIYGSDFHGIVDKEHPDYETLKKRLFYMKSERTFDGLKLALLDQESRIFTEERFNSCKKDDSTWIRKINLSINDNDYSINLGDALNSIIGARGSGKSYLINSLLNGGDYDNSEIKNQIKLKSVEYANGEIKQYLEENKYDYLSQRNAKKDNKSSIYNVLSDAPYNVNSFIKFINENNNAKTIEKTSDIENLIEILNFKLDSCHRIAKIINDKFDNSFIGDYCKYSNDLKYNPLINSIFANANNFYSNQIKLKRESSKEINETIKLLERVNENLSNISKTTEYSKLDHIEVTRYKNYNYDTKDMINILRKIDGLVNLNIEKVSKVYKRTSSIEEYIRKQMSNRELSYENNFENLKKIIHELKDNISTLKEGNDQLKKTISGDVKNMEIIQFNLGNRECLLKITHHIKLNSMTDEVNDSIFRNYKKETNVVNIFNSIEKRGTIDEINKIVDRIDHRSNDFHLQVPDNGTLEADVEVASRVNGEFENISTMSPGERSSLLLDLILNAEKSRVLIIDQPEDDLDNETIYRTIVTKLRELKLRRQIIVVTHNANICIIGDSDSIIVCENDNGKFSCFSDTMESENKYNYSSTVNELKQKKILEITAHILDGGKEALRRRIKVFGQKDVLFKEEN